MARLILTSPEGQQVVTLAARNSLGRHPDSSIQILDKIVSKEHCRILLEGKTWVLQDLDSLNGTFLNGTRLTGSHPLQHGDEFSLGATRARFEQDGSSPDPVVAPVPSATATRPFVAAPVTSPDLPPVRPPQAGGPNAFSATARRMEAFEAAKKAGSRAIVRGAAAIRAIGQGPPVAAIVRRHNTAVQKLNIRGTPVRLNRAGIRGRKSPGALLLNCR